MPIGIIDTLQQMWWPCWRRDQWFASRWPVATTTKTMATKDLVFRPPTPISTAEAAVGGRSVEAVVVVLDIENTSDRDAIEIETSRVRFHSDPDRDE